MILVRSLDIKELEDCFFSKLVMILGVKINAWKISETDIIFHFSHTPHFQQSFYRETLKKNVPYRDS